jgi:hypothetical protein
MVKCKNESLTSFYIARNLRCSLIVKSFSLIIRLKVSFAELDGITLSCFTSFSSLLLGDCWSFLNLIQSLKSIRTIRFIFVWLLVHDWSSMWIASLWCTNFLVLIGKVVKIVPFKNHFTVSLLTVFMPRTSSDNWCHCFYVPSHLAVFLSCRYTP